MLLKCKYVCTNAFKKQMIKTKNFFYEIQNQFILVCDNKLLGAYYRPSKQKYLMNFLQVIDYKVVKITSPLIHSTFRYILNSMSGKERETVKMRTRQSVQEAGSSPNGKEGNGAQKQEPSIPMKCLIDDCNLDSVSNTEKLNLLCLEVSKLPGLFCELRELREENQQKDKFSTLKSASMLLNNIHDRTIL